MIQVELERCKMGLQELNARRAYEKAVIATAFGQNEIHNVMAMWIQVSSLHFLLFNLLSV
jgi:hypothetical protein